MSIPQSAQGPYVWNRVAPTPLSGLKSRDNAIDGFFNKASILTENLEKPEKGGEQGLTRSELGGTRNPIKDMMSKYFSQYATGHNADGDSMMTPNDVARFINETNFGEHEPATDVAGNVIPQKVTPGLVASVKNYFGSLSSLKGFGAASGQTLGQAAKDAKDLRETLKNQ